jgi:hypothetical protein
MDQVFGKDRAADKAGPCRDPFLDQGGSAARRRVRCSPRRALPLGSPPAAAAPSHPERSDDLIGSRHRHSSADRRVS